MHLRSFEADFSKLASHTNFISIWDQSLPVFLILLFVPNIHVTVFYDIMNNNCDLQGKILSMLEQTKKMWMWLGMWYKYSVLFLLRVLTVLQNVFCIFCTVNNILSWHFYIATGWWRRFTIYSYLIKYNILSGDVSIYWYGLSYIRCWMFLFFLSEMLKNFHDLDFKMRMVDYLSLLW